MSLSDKEKADQRIKELEAALEELASCDFDHGYAEDTYSTTCRKCIALRRLKNE